MTRPGESCSSPAKDRCCGSTSRRWCSKLRRFLSGSLSFPLPKRVEARGKQDIEVRECELVPSHARSIERFELFQRMPAIEVVGPVVPKRLEWIAIENHIAFRGVAKCEAPPIYLMLEVPGGRLVGRALEEVGNLGNDLSAARGAEGARGGRFADSTRPLKTDDRHASCEWLNACVSAAAAHDVTGRRRLQTSVRPPYQTAHRCR